eukprot:COSAG01_NODE_878_length_12950_cov_16.832853_6_plen_84_part_00
MITRQQLPDPQLLHTCISTSGGSRLWRGLGMHERAAEGRGCVAGAQWRGGVGERGWLSATSKLAIVRDFGVICFHSNCRATSL